MSEDQACIAVLRAWLGLNLNLSYGRGDRLIRRTRTFFDEGTFLAPMIDRVTPLADGRTAYEQVARGEARGRLVLVR